MLFTFIFVSLFIIGWSFCGLVPWLIASIASRGNAGMSMLPLCLFAANVAAVLVPLLGADGRGGLIASFPVAMGTSAALVLLRRFTVGSLSEKARSAVPESTANEPRTPDRG